MLNRILARLRRAAAAERGYTLPELLISVVLTGVIVATLATAMVAMLRNVDSTSKRQDRAHSTEISANYFASDAAAARAAGISTGNGLTCGTGGVGVASFTWNDFNNGSTASTTKVANWVVKDNKLLRRLCVIKGTPPASELKSTLTMSETLKPGSVPVATMTTDAASGSTKISLPVAQPPVDPQASSDDITFTLQGTTRPAGTAPNALTPPNLLLLEPSGTGLALGLASLDIVKTEAGSNQPSSGYINSTSSAAISSAFVSQVNGTLYSPGRCDAGFFASCPTVVDNPAVPDPLKNLKSPATNTAWLQQANLTTFSGSACNLNLTGINSACPDLGPGIYTKPLWLKNANSTLGGTCTEQTCPYILQAGMKIGSSGVAPNITSRPGVLIDLEGGTISPTGGWTGGANLSFDASTGGPYAGVSIFQPSTNTTDLELLWNGTLRTNGLVYMPKAGVFSGGQWSGSAILNSLIANDLTVGGSISFQIGGLERPGPKITQLLPAYGGQGAANRQVVLTGSNFQSGATVQFGDGPASSGVSLAGSPTVSDGGTKLTFGVDITPGAPVGTTKVTVTNPDGTAISKASAFTILPAPTVTSISPVSRGQGATNQTVTIDGTGFLNGTTYPPGTTLAFSNTGITVNSMVVTSATRLTANISVAADAVPGAVDVTVSNLAATGSPAVVKVDGFNVSKKPTVTAVTPSSGGQGQVGYPITITGTDFQSTAKASFPLASGITVKSTTYVSPTQLDATLDIGILAPTAASTISVDNGDGTAPGTLADAFTVLPAPKVVSVLPTAGPPAGGTTVTVTGTGFSGATSVLFGSTSVTPSINVAGTIITVVSPPGTGTVDVRVVTPIGTSVALPTGGTFTYGAPTVTGLSPTGGITTGLNNVTITGTGFTSDSTVKFGSNLAVVTAVTPTSMTVKAPAGTAGTKTVTVTNPVGTNATNHPADYYTYGVPTITSVSPTSGLVTGGTTVTVNGTGFLTTAGVKFGSSSATGVNVISDTQLTAVSPVGSAGLVQVSVTNGAGTSSNVAADDFTYLKAGQTITFAGPSAGAVGNTDTLAATSSSGLPVSFTSATTSVCTVSGTTVTYVAVGTCTINANQPGNADFSAAPQVAQNVTVAKGNQTITFAGPASGAFGGTATLTGTATSGLAPTFTSATTGVCTVSGTTVTYVALGTCTINANQAGNVNWNAAAQVARSFTVGKGSQTITFAGPANGTVDGTATLSATSSSGLAVTFSSNSPAVCTVAGTTVTYQTVGTCSIDADQAGNGTWNAATTVTRTNTVGKGSQTITFAGPANGTVNGTATLSATSSSGLPVTFTSATTGVCTITGGTTVNYNAAGTCTINANQAGDANYNAAPQVQRFNTIAKGAQTISFTQPANGTVGTTATLNATSTSGLTVTFTSATTGVCTITGGTTVNYNAVGTCTINANQAGDANYNAAPQVQRFNTIAKGAQTISFTQPANGTVGTTATLNATSTSGLTVTFTSATTGVCTITGGTTVNYNAVGTCTINANQAGDANYNAAPQVQRSNTIAKGAQTISFTQPATGAVDGTAGLAASSTSGLTVTFTSATPAVCTVAGSTVSYETAGNCTINANQAGDANWNAATQVQRSNTVGKGAQSITFAAAPGGAVGTTAAVSATSSAGLTVTFSPATPATCTVAGTTVTFVGAGTCTINANQAGNANYNAATQVQRSSTVTKGSQTITFPNPGNGKVGTTDTLSATASSGQAVTFASTTPSTCSVSGTTLTYLAVSSCTVRASQAGNVDYNAAANVDQTMTVAKGDPTIGFTLPATAYTGTTASLSATSSSGTAVTFSASSSPAGRCSIAGSTLSYTGTGTCTVTASVVSSTNWNSATTSRNVTVTTQPAPTVANLDLQNGSGSGNATGRIDQGDKVVITFDQDINSSTICSYWANDGNDKTTVGTGRTITATLENAGGAGSNDSISFANSGGGTCNIGEIDLGANGYTPGTRTYTGSTAVWDVSAKTLTITLGSRSGDVTSRTSSNATYTPSNLVKNQSGTAITGTFSTGNVKQF